MVSSGYEGVGNQRFIGFRNRTKERLDGQEFAHMILFFLFFILQYYFILLFTPHDHIYILLFPLYLLVFIVLSLYLMV